MRKTVIAQLIFLLIASYSSGQGQSIEELRVVSSKVRDPFIKPEVLDQIMFNLRVYESNPLPDQDSLLLDIYRTVSNSYMANNHFKKAYQVFSRYLAYKEQMLANDKAASINSLMNKIGERSRNDENEYRDLMHQVSELREGNVILENRRLTFKRNFSFGLIFLSAMFAIMLVGSGIKMMNLRSKLNQNRDRMKAIHRNAVIGKYEDGVGNSLNDSLPELERQLKEFKAELKNS